jgi:hypothetical protein
MHRSKVDHCLVSRALLDCNAVLAAGISAKAGVGNSLHFAMYVEIDFRCALGIERTNAGAADIVDMEPRMPYMRNEKRKTKYSATFMEGLQQAAVLTETVSTRELVQAYMQARSKAEVRHGKSAGRIHGRDRRTCMPDGQWIDRPTDWEAVGGRKCGGSRSTSGSGRGSGASQGRMHGEHAASDGVG